MTIKLVNGNLEVSGVVLEPKFIDREPEISEEDKKKILEAHKILTESEDLEVDITSIWR